MAMLELHIVNLWFPNSRHLLYVHSSRFFLIILILRSYLQFPAFAKLDFTLCLIQDLKGVLILSSDSLNFFYHMMARVSTSLNS